MQRDEDLDAAVTRRYLQIRYQPTGAVVAEGPLGWGVTPFEGNYYIRRRYLRDGSFRPDFVPGVCVYKGLYIGLDYTTPGGAMIKHLGWMHWLPNPLFPFIMFRVAVPAVHPLLVVESIDEITGYPHGQTPQIAAPDQREQTSPTPTDAGTRHVA